MTSAENCDILLGWGEGYEPVRARPQKIIVVVLLLARWRAYKKIIIVILLLGAFGAGEKKSEAGLLPPRFRLAPYFSAR